MLTIALGLTFLFFVVYWSFRDWRRAVKAVFLILVIDGAFRKWFLPQASEFIYFFKDFVLFGAYLRYYLYPRPDEPRYPIPNSFVNILIVLASAWCVFQASNPHLGSFLVGILGLKSYLFYIPLIWMMPYLFRSEEELYIFLRNHLFLLIPVGILGIVQFFSPINSPINQYIPGRNEPIATFGFAGSQNVRITGTFSYLNSYQGYLSACFGLLIPIIGYPKTKQWQWIVYAMVFFIALNAFMTGSRTPIFASIVFLIGYFGIRIIKNPEQLILIISRLTTFLLFTIPIFWIAFRKVVESFWLRVSSNEDVGSRVALGFVGPFDLVGATGLDGFGVGATHAGTLSFQLALGLPISPPLPVEVEAEMGRVALELGPIGMMLWYGMRVWIIVVLFQIFMQLKRPFLRDLALAGALIHSVLFINQMVFHNTFGLYYWFYTGFIFLLPWLERVENWRSQQQYYAQWYAEQAFDGSDPSHG
ncbi:hypothetical protein VB712_19110 [Spirulina sp. CCNP1310]|uniref:hypothetical protein n=1 Tax=Spirulina sp. CCNP1310 TaxID=3110249 RepID=UPI002B1FC787|nr:hypothetical protein [Spirulina sp. CCNP1310]MEA5421339.1 hypothetical protein [Spirulina sp. CCNP1310]